MNTVDISNIIVTAFQNCNKLMICGNGGSAAEAQHMAAELMGKFEYYRKPLPALALTTDTSFLTAWPNDNPEDLGFHMIFARQVEALGKEGDVLIGLSTSGKSRNVLEAYKQALKMGIKVVDLPRIGNSTAEIQENQLKLIHQICRAVEKAFIEF